MKPSFQDDELKNFEAQGAEPLPDAGSEGRVDVNGALIWFGVYGAGKPVILLHGGLGSSGNWGYQVAALVAHGYQAITIDSRGHGRSTHTGEAYHYQQMVGDVLAVMDHLGVEKASLVGWSDGAVVALLLAMQHPERVAGVFYFACNMDPSGVKPEMDFTPALGSCYNRHIKDYQALSATPDNFEAFSQAVSQMQKSEPDVAREQLAQIRVPVAVVQSKNDEFIKPEHAVYLAESIPGAELFWLEDVSHFAPLQRPEMFNQRLLGYLDSIG